MKRKFFDFIFGTEFGRIIFVFGGGLLLSTIFIYTLHYFNIL